MAGDAQPHIRRTPNLGLRTPLAVAQESGLVSGERTLRLQALDSSLLSDFALVLDGSCNPRYGLPHQAPVGTGVAMAKISVRLDNGDLVSEFAVPDQDIIVDDDDGTGANFATDAARQQFSNAVCEAALEAFEQERSS